MQLAAVLLLFRHLHFFVVINDLPQPPTLQMTTRQYYVYTDPLRLNVYGEEGARLLQTTVAVGSQLERQLPGPNRQFYLVEADPGMNGATFDCDRPWGVMGSANHPMGVNGSGPTLYFYVPPDCAEFTLAAQSVSPNEGGRVVVTDEAGNQAAVLDGELNAEEKTQVEVPQRSRGRIWSLQWGKPTTTQAALDDLNFHLDGDLTPLLFPRQEWAQKYGKMVWERDVAARQRQQLREAP